MSLRARRLYPVAVLLAGAAAATAVVPLAQRARVADRARADQRAAQLVAATVAARAEALARGVRGPALAFDLESLPAEQVTGLLRLVYAQSEGVAAVTLLDRDGNPVSLRGEGGASAPLPAVFLPRAGGTGVHPVESLDDLDRFSREIPLAAALARGRALRGPYASARGDGARVAMVEAVPVAEGTDTWLLAAELDAERLVEGLTLGDGGEVVLAGSEVLVGTLARAPEGARAALRATARRAATVREPEVLAGPGWRAAVAAAPGGLDAVVAVVWSGEDDALRRARSGELALGVVVLSIVGALAAALAVLSREKDQARAGASAAGAQAAEARVLGAVVKELANPIAATSAAAKLVASDRAPGRVAETLQRSVVRTERAFRRVARLARAGEERARESVDLAALARREGAAAQKELEHAGASLALEVPDGAVVVRGDPDDLAMLVEVLLDAARAVSPAKAAVALALRKEGDAARLSVRDRGAPRAKERAAMTALEEGTRTEAAAPVLAWALAARIAQDHQAGFEMRDAEGGGVEVVVTLAAG